MKRAFVDWRGPNPKVWTKARRQMLGEFDLRSVASTWDRDPAGEAPGLTLVAQAPCLYELDGKCAPWMQEAKDNRWDCVYGLRRAIWTDGGRQAMYMLNLAEPKCAGWFGTTMATQFAWADGWHLDYATKFEYLFALGENARTYWNAYGDGIKGMIDAYHQCRPGAPVLAQQYATRPYLAGAAGLFLEQGPTIFGRTLAQHANEMLRAQPSMTVVEIQPVARFPQSYIDQAVRFAEDPGAFAQVQQPNGTYAAAPGAVAEAYVSMGRDALAWA